MIAYNEKCLRYKYKEKNSSLWYTIDQYHGKQECIEKMKATHKSLFMQKKWTDKEMQGIANNMQSE